MRASKHLAEESATKAEAQVWCTGEIGGNWGGNHPWGKQLMNLSIGALDDR